MLEQFLPTRLTLSTHTGERVAWQLAAGAQLLQ